MGLGVAGVVFDSEVKGGYNRRFAGRGELGTEGFENLWS